MAALEAVRSSGNVNRVTAPINNRVAKCTDSSIRTTTMSVGATLTIAVRLAPAAMAAKKAKDRATPSSKESMGE